MEGGAEVNRKEEGDGGMRDGGVEVMRVEDYGQEQTHVN